jgi:hypothetical protein
VTAPGNGTNLLVSVPSRHDFEATLRRLREQMNARGATVFAEVDHRANAHTVKLEMPSTTVLLFGNPRGGTPPMLVAPELAYRCWTCSRKPRCGWGSSIMSPQPALAVALIEPSWPCG